MRISVQDACPVREKPQVHRAVRNLLEKMNIEIIETEFSGRRTICCGDDLFPNLPIDQIHRQMKKRADSMRRRRGMCILCFLYQSNAHRRQINRNTLLTCLWGKKPSPRFTIPRSGINNWTIISISIKRWQKSPITSAFQAADKV